VAIVVRLQLFLFQPAQINMETSRTIPNIWYRSKPITEPSTADEAIRERGTLHIGPDSLHFKGPQTDLTIRNVEAVEYGVHGTMMNPSVHVRYLDGESSRSAYFTDGRAGGYAGLYGGTRKLAESMQHLGSVRYDDAQSNRSRRLWTMAIVILVLIFVIRMLLSMAR
jgi:hypothetical protein